ncbi:MAG: DMT family transporter [Treponema sp.]|jgi:drug/metabolite transporter (DMT)-like permease|nr:DMT family transporter [Treponema sp.]
MHTRILRADALLLLTACIWGFAFVAQRTGMEYVGPFTFNGIRFILGSLSLLPLIIYRRRSRGSSVGAGKKACIRASLLAGSCLFIGASLQQIGIIYTTAGHAGFITGLYVVLVPLFGIALKRKTGLPTWIGAACTLVGLFFLSAAGKNMSAINLGDSITAIGAIFWALHVLVIDRLVQKVDPLILSAGQFAWCGICSLAVALGTEPFSGTSLFQGLLPILYGGICSVGVAYTLQVVAQRDAPPAHATIILCLEGVFAAIGGVIILAEPLGSWTILGFICMFCGMVATQWELIAGGGHAPP